MRAARFALVLCLCLANSARAGVFRLLDEAYTASRKTTSEIENAIRVSFLEYFEFQGHKDQVRQLLGPSLTELYDDQMRYMEDLARRAAEQRAAADADEPRP